MGRRGAPAAPQDWSKTYPAAPLDAQMYPSGSKKCASWAQGYQHDTQSGPKRAQLVLKDAQSSLKVLPKVALEVPTRAKNEDTV